WDKVDRGSELLADVLSAEKLRGPVLDLGAGWGYLASRLPERLEIHLLEADLRGLEACRLNLEGHRLHLHWADGTDPKTLPQKMQDRFPVVVTNPPFHTHKKADPVLGGAFVSTAAWSLKPGGVL